MSAITLEPNTDYVRAYQSLYGVTLRLALEYDALPPAGRGGGINGNDKSSAYALAIKDVCADGDADVRPTNISNRH